jgi:hypothetical protein
MRITVLALLLAARSAAACPFCDGTADAGNPVKEAVFGPDFGTNLLLTALPFAVTFVAVAAIRYAPPWEGRP